MELDQHLASSYSHFPAFHVKMKKAPSHRNLSVLQWVFKCDISQPEHIADYFSLLFSGILIYPVTLRS